MKLYGFNADNYIDGSVFIALTPSEIRDMVAPIGLAKKISNLIPKMSFHTNECVGCVGFILLSPFVG